MKGNIVLTVAMFGHSEGLDMSGEDKKNFDALHFDKIEISDEILVLDIANYIGESTKNEIEHAKKLNKPIRYLSKEITGVNSRWKVGDILYSQPTGKIKDKITKVEQFDNIRYSFDNGDILWDTPYHWKNWTNDICYLKEKDAN